MSKIILAALAGFVLGAAATWTFLHPHDGRKVEEEHAAESRILRTNGQTFVKLDKAAQEHAGLKLAPLEALVRKPEVKGYGRVLDPAPLAAQVASLATARAALVASTREYQRLKTLHAQEQNVSTRALETADTAVKRDQIATDAAELALVTAWGKPVANQPDLPAFARSLASLETALVRIDLPLGTPLKSIPTSGRIAALAREESPLEAELIGPVASADPQTQSQGFLLRLSKSPPPGTAVSGWLMMPGGEERGVLVPRAALVRHEGEVFVYLQSGDEWFRRQAVELDHPTEKGWFVGKSLTAGQNIVVAGAQQLLSEELKGRGGEE